MNARITRQINADGKKPGQRAIVSNVSEYYCLSPVFGMCMASVYLKEKCNQGEENNSSLQW